MGMDAAACMACSTPPMHTCPCLLPYIAVERLIGQQKMGAVTDLFSLARIPQRFSSSPGQVVSHCSLSTPGAGSSSRAGQGPAWADQQQLEEAVLEAVPEAFYDPKVRW